MQDISKYQQILFLCDRNASRSPMAQTMLRAYLGDDAPDILSAGLDPCDYVDPFAVCVLHEHNLDVSTHTPRALEVGTCVPKGTLIVALSPACQAFAKDWQKKCNFDLLSWDIPTPPTTDLPRDMMLEGYRAIRSSLNTHIKAHFLPKFR